MKHKALLKFTAMALVLFMLMPIVMQLPVCFAESSEGDGTEYLYQTDFNQMTVGAASATDASINPVKWKAATTVVEPVAGSGDKVWRIYLKGTNGGKQTAVHYGSTAALVMPAVSYTNYDLVALEFDIFVGANSTGGLRVAYNKGMAKADGTVNGTKKTQQTLDLYTPEFFRLDFTANSNTALLHGGTNGSSQYATVNKGEWHTVTMVLGMKDCTVMGYLDGDKVFENKLSLKMWDGKAKVSRNVENPTNLTLLENELCFLGIDEFKAGNYEGEVLIDNFKIYETVKIVNDTLLETDFDNMTVGLASATDASINPVQWKASTSVVEPEAGSGDKAWRIYLKGTNGGKDTVAHYGSTAALKIPAISYSAYDQAVFDLDVLIGESSTGAIRVCYNNGEAKADGTFNGTKKTQQTLSAYTPELFSLDFTADSNTATFTGGVNTSSSTAPLLKGEWNRITVVVDLKGCAITGYLNGVKAFSSALTVTAWLSSKTVKAVSPANLSLGANALCFLGVDACKTGNYEGEVLVDNVKVYGMNDKAVQNSTVKYPTVDQDGNVLNYVSYGDQKMTGTQYFVTKDTVCTPVYFDSSIYGGLIATEDAASIRLNAPTAEDAERTTSGIRFATKINDVALFDSLMALQESGELTTVTFGTLIAPSDYLKGNALTKGLGEGRYLDVKADYGEYYSFDNDPASTHFVGSIANLYTANLGRGFSARGYVEITLISGRVITLYGDVVQRSIKQVSAALLADEGLTWTDDQYAQLVRYAAVEDWKTEEEEMDTSVKKVLTEVGISTGSSASELYAGEELRSYLAKKNVTVSENGFPIVLAIDKTLGDDSYRIEATLSEGEGMTITGGNGRGVLYGVYAFLEDYAGFRFYTADVETFDDRAVAITEGVLREYTPAFEMRQIDWYSVKSEYAWCVKNGINISNAWGKSIGDEMGGCWNYGSMFVHTFGKMMGTGNAWSANPCLTDPANLEATIAYVKNVLAENPDINIVSVSQNDSTEYCHCASCAAIDAEEGSPAGTLLRFVNAVAEEIEKDYPHVTIDTLAYKYTQKAPLITKPRDNVCIRLCSINCDFTQPLTSANSADNQAFCNDLLAWSQICDNIYIWDYTTNYHYYMATFPNLGVLRENMKFFAEHNVKGMYPQGNSDSASGEFGELRAYLLVKLMVDPYMTEEEYNAYIDGFLEAYYGEGWGYIRAYIDQTTALASARLQGIYDFPLNGITSAEYKAYEQIFNGYWDEAERLAGDRLEYVQRSRMQWRYVQLMLHPNGEDAKLLIEDAKKWNIAWREGKKTVDPGSNLDAPPNQWSYSA